MAIRAAADAAPHLGFHLLAPALPSGALPMELEALLPNRRHNDELMAGCSRHSARRALKATLSRRCSPPIRSSTCAR